MATWRYHFCDALTGVLLEELPLNVASFDQKINDVGSLTGTLALGGLGAGRDWQGATTPRRTLLIALRDEVIAWGGLIMKRRPANGGAVAEISAETLEGYWARRRIKTDVPFTVADVFNIIRGILTQAQAVPGGNMRMTVGANLAGYSTSVTYLGKDRTKVLDAWKRLAEVYPGFEFAITWSRSGNVYSPALTLATPGLSSGLAPITAEYPGSLVDYDYPEDGTAATNALTGVGADLGGAPLMFEIVDSGEQAAGVPIFEGEYQIKDEDDFGRLASRTQTALSAALSDYVVPTAVAKGGGGDLQFGQFPLGVSVRLRLTSMYHPAGTNGAPGIEVVRRVTGWSVVPTPVERVSLTLASTTGKITLPAHAQTPQQRLADIDARLRILETT